MSAAATRARATMAGEAVRGVPLVTQLLFASFVLPLLLGGGPGRIVTGDGEVRVRFDGAAEYANYQISRDPLQRWALVATAMSAMVTSSVSPERWEIMQR